MNISLFEYDPLYMLFARLKLATHDRVRTLPLTLVVFFLTWVPITLLAADQGVALGDTIRESFLYDFAAYALFFVSIPLDLGLFRRLTVSALTPILPLLLDLSPFLKMFAEFVVKLLE